MLTIIINNCDRSLRWHLDINAIVNCGQAESELLITLTDNIIKDGDVETNLTILIGRIKYNLLRDRGKVST